MEEAKKRMDPGADFTLLEDGCVIKGVDHEAADKTDDNGRNEDTTRCADKYTWRYEMIASEGWEEFDSTYYSEVTILWRCKNGYQCKCAQTNQRYRVGYSVNETVDCWAPTNDPATITRRTDDLESGYDCTHTDCIKLDDPKEDKQENLADGNATFITGSVMIALSVIGCAYAAILLCPCRSRK